MSLTFDPVELVRTSREILRKSDAKLAELDLRELRKLARIIKIKNYSQLAKDDLLKTLKEDSKTVVGAYLMTATDDLEVSTSSNQERTLEAFRALCDLASKDWDAERMKTRVEVIFEGFWNYPASLTPSDHTRASNLTECRNLFDSEQESLSHFLHGEALKPLLEYFDTLHARRVRPLRMKSNREYAARVAERNHAQKEVSVGDLLTDALNTLKSPEGASWQELSFAVALTTGRRMNEVHCFQSTIEVMPQPDIDPLHKGSDATLMRFSGISKVRGDDDRAQLPIMIPVLADPEKIVRALELLELKGKRFTKRSEVNKGVSMGLSRWMKKIDLGEDSPELTYKSLRAIYAAVCLKWYEPKNKSPNAYLSSILGHLERDLSTAASYQVFSVPSLKDLGVVD